ncbi:transglutaminase domain-containing protein [Gulosibacter macacae]|uniref:Transglutaminase domain-containing protein n=1 Tax=Gulosibacter macacae TaxID=2488791 RepID=A0A3P3VVW8_9MICO|nr:transglutaminase domain-containing protein [Gulosibacter macacae]
MSSSVTRASLRRNRRQAARSGNRLAIVLGFVVLLFAFGVVAHEPVFGNGFGLQTAGAGAVIGIVIATLASLFGWRWYVTAAAAVLSYFALGGLIALPSTTIAGIVPSLQTLQLLIVQLANSWKDLLTLVPPAHPFIGPSVLPFASGIVAAIATTLLALGGRWLLALLPAALFAFIGAAWSVPYAPNELWWALGFAVVTGIWCAVNTAWDRADRGEDVVIGAEASAAARAAGGAASRTETGTGRLRQRQRVANAWWRRALGVAGALGIGVLIAAVLVPMWADGRARTVLREYVAPPLQVHDLPTPLEQFRHLSTDLIDEELFSVTDLPEGARVRIATMDEYDGVRWGIAPPVGEAPGFVQIGEVVASASEAVRPNGSLDYETSLIARQPVDRWVPTIGHIEHINVGDEAVANALFYDVNGQTALTTVTPPADLAIDVAGWVEPVWSESQLAGLPLGSAPVGTPQLVPEAVTALALTVTQTAASPLDRARALERYFRDTGYYANGIEYPSRPGHSAARIAQLLEGEQLIGDDEQYATAMALTATSLGMPARVVIGAYPEHYAEGTISLRGSDMHVWVEIQFDGVGWVPFDPTPPKDQVPQTEVPEPRSVPQPQVLQPPEPPQEPPQLPTDADDRDADDPLEAPVPFPWLIVGSGSALVLLLLIPLIGVPLVKILRRRRRRKSEGRDGVRGAWHEVTDAAVDSGLKLGTASTALEDAELLELQQPLDGAAVTLARQLGAAEFSGAHVSPESVREAWDAEAQVRRALFTDGRWARMRARWSWRTLRRRQRSTRKG